jgi:hypothetical protein
MINLDRIYLDKAEENLAADYKTDHMTEDKARRALRRTDEFVCAVIGQEGESP